MIDWTKFIKCNRGLLIAPAGHGKTTAIADCLLQCPDDSCQLVLTHTHAGIASLRTKFRKKNIPLSRYQLETITGFAQRYVLSFLGSSSLPGEEESVYFDIVVEKCCTLMQSNAVQTIIKASFNGIFVDEYQDCTIDQHNMIMELAHNLPLHLLGDPLQGIFSFEQKPLVNFNKDLGFFTRFALLDYPWRWKESNPALGEIILNMRCSLEKGQTIELQNKPEVGFYVIGCSSNSDEKFKCLGRLIQHHDCNNLLVICPSYRDFDKYGHSRLKGDLNDRIKIKQRVDYGNRFSIVDAIDSSEYYRCAREIDTFVAKCSQGRRIHRIARLFDILEKLHLNLSELSKWINKGDNTFRHRTKENALLSERMIELFTTFETDKTLASLRNVITFVVDLPKIKCYHQNLYHTINRCFDIAQANSVSMFEAMKLFKTRIRHQGRRFEGKCFGTTLLTKGLEFDTVIIWDAHKFEDTKNFYVAISRACNKLIIITEFTSLNFNH